MFALYLSFLLLSGVSGLRERSARVNPIRRVVTLLQDMQKKVIAEGAAEQELFEKFKCYCKSGSGDLSASIGAAETKIPQVDSSLAQAESLLNQLEGELSQHKADRANAKDAVSSASAIREKEAGAFAK